MPEVCKTCGDEGWVCEIHENRSWNYGAGHIYRKKTAKIRVCHAAGKPCPKCNFNSPPWKIEGKHR